VEKSSFLEGPPAFAARALAAAERPAVEAVGGRKCEVETLPMMS